MGALSKVLKTKTNVTHLIISIKKNAKNQHHFHNHQGSANSFIIISIKRRNNL